MTACKYGFGREYVARAALKERVARRICRVMGHPEEKSWQWRWLGFKGKIHHRDLWRQYLPIAEVAINNTLSAAAEHVGRHAAHFSPEERRTIREIQGAILYLGTTEGEI